MKNNYIEKYVKENPEPPKIERVDKFETYLLDKNDKRIKRICGVKKRNFPKGYVCKNNAGLRTTHPSWGKCYICEKERGKRLYMSLTELNDKVKEITGKEIYPQIKEGLEVARVLNGRMDSLVQEVEIVNSLLVTLLINKDKKDKMASSDVFKIIDVVKELRNLKETQFKIKKEAALDLRVISAFIDKIFSILCQNLDLPQARELMEKIKADAIVPIASIAGKEGDKLQSDITKSLDTNTAENMFIIEDIKDEDKNENVEFEDMDFDKIELESD